MCQWRLDSRSLINPQLTVGVCGDVALRSCGVGVMGGLEFVADF